MRQVRTRRLPRRRAEFLAEAVALRERLSRFDHGLVDEYKRAGRGLEIRYGFHAGPFGEFLIAQTARGVCGLAFVTDRGRAAAIEDLRSRNVI